MSFIRELRYLLARSFFLAMGLRIGYWRRMVERAWLTQSRGRDIESILETYAPRDANGRGVNNHTKLQEAPTQTKMAFRQSTSKPDKVALFHRHTAGSSGEPTHIWLDRRELGRMLGVRDYCYRYCGIRVGDKEGRLWGRPDRGLKNSIKNFVLNRRVFHPSGQKLEGEVQALIHWQPTYLYGYASLLLECARYLAHTTQTIPALQCVIVTAETILPSQKEYLSRVFRCPVYEEYGATEFDTIAFECRFGHRHLVNPWLVVEIGADDQALVTDCSRRSHSLVRYELGDILTLKNTDCPEIGSQQIISRLEGRTSNRFALTAEYERFHAVEFAYAIDSYQRQYGDLFQFVVTQNRAGTFLLACSPEPCAGSVSVAQHVERAIRQKTGYDVRVEMEPYLESQGKTSYFIQNMGNAYGSRQAMEAIES